MFTLYCTTITACRKQYFFISSLIVTVKCKKINKNMLSVFFPPHLHVLFYPLFQGCGGTLTTASGAFSSPNYPLPYHPNAECYWNIRTNQGNKLLLSFSDFHLESNANCYYDYVAVSILPLSHMVALLCKTKV